MKKKPSRPIDRSLLGDADVRALDPIALDTPERILAFCEERGFIKGSYTDIQAVIEDNPEIELRFEELGEYDAYIRKDGDGKFTIGINIKHAKTRQRFSMAHEYVHYQIHRQRINDMAHGEQIMHRNWERDPQEYQANEYAAELLMPEKTFAAKVLELKGKVLLLANEFIVSPQAVRMRASKLGYQVNEL